MNPSRASNRRRERDEIIRGGEGSLTPDDAALGVRVLENLKRSAVLEFPADLRMTLCAGVVRLEGAVTFPAEKAMIEEVVRFTEGVLAVENALHLLPCASRRSSP